MIVKQGGDISTMDDINNGKELVNLIRVLVKEKKQKLGNVTECVVESVDKDFYVNLFILPNTDNVVKNIPNPFGVYCEIGDVVLLYKVNNNINTSFIIANKTQRDRKVNINGGGVIYASTGKMGPTGKKGEPGKQGADGLPGAAGGRGPQGSIGGHGASGTTGSQGAQGGQGDKDST